jgi:predicted methyltransferase
MNKQACIAAAGLVLIAFSAPAPAAEIPDYIAKAVNDPSRPSDDRKLDANRKPAEVLAFADVKPDETVGEFLPGGGYYTRMLSDIVGPNGKIDALETTRWGADNINAAEAILNEPGRGNVSLDLSPFGEFRLTDKVDLFWTTLNYHDLHVARYGRVDILAFNKHVFDSLKPGGIYFIEDHAAANGTGDTLSPKLHRIEKALVIKEVTEAGFKFVGESDILRNPGDDHTKTVFDPTTRWHTDQFLLKFRRPA